VKITKSGKTKKPFTAVNGAGNYVQHKLPAFFFEWINISWMYYS